MPRCLALLAFLVGPVLMAADESKSEDGFAPLFNGQDLSGWKLKQGGVALEGKSEAANGRFVVKDGVLVIDPKVKGDLTIETVKTYGGDAVIRFEFKPGPGCNNDLFFRGTKFDINKKGDPKNLREGEWNTFEIVVKGGSAEFFCNGEKVKTLKVKPMATPFGIRAEFGPIEVRKLRIKA